MNRTARFMSATISGIVIPRLAAVDDREDGVASLEQFVDRHRVDRLVRREPAAADDPDDRRPVGVGLGREHVHGQRRAELPPVDDVLLAGEIGGGLHAFTLGAGRGVRMTGK